MAISVPDSPLTANTTIDIDVANPGQSGRLITVTMDNGGDGSEDVQIQLDDDGNGTGHWVVANWTSVNFNTPGCPAVNRSIVP